MASQTRKEKISTSTLIEQPCANPRCFFCILKEPKSSVRRTGIGRCFEEMQLTDNEDHVLVLSALWNIAMTHPNDPEFPSLGIFKCMASLISRGISDVAWLLAGQNIYIPYYAAHIIGSYTMNKVEFAEKAVESGVITPLMQLMSGKMTWVEQRVAVRALGHLASYDKTFEAVAEHEEQIIKMAISLATTCLGSVFDMFVGVKDENTRLNYHCDLLTRGIGGVELQNRKAEEWASQIQCWSIHLLNCFAIKERSIDIICDQDFLEKLCEMWGGLVNYTSPAGVGLIRVLCYTKTGRTRVAESTKVIKNLCNLSRSSDDWQYIGVDCLLSLLKDPETRYMVIEIAIFFLIDLVELGTIRERPNVGETITRTLLRDFKNNKSKIKIDRVQKALQEIWVLKVDKRMKEKFMSSEKTEELKVMVSLIKQQGNHSFVLGNIEEAAMKYTEALKICPLKFRKERTVLYSNRAQCHLLLGDSDSTISDTTRALCLSNPPNSHPKSLWRRSQAYDMKGMALESLMDCLMFVNSCYTKPTKDVKIPYYAMRMISKQMDATCLFAASRAKLMNKYVPRTHESGDSTECIHDNGVKGKIIENKAFMSSLSTILEEPFMSGSTSRRKLERDRRRNKSALSF
ncbi:uncharacterized protein LOC141710517 [Apium graveolens]|uniref:uncharacterized protein LOC141710517 n=1 Tax=Apium graveolens TaxID=4045 RepID=UPI003D798F98